MDLRALGILASSAAAVALFLLVGNPGLGQWRQARADHVALVSTRDQEERNTVAFEKLKREVAERKSDIEKLNSLAPTIHDPKSDVPELLEVFRGLALESGIILKAVNVGTVEASQADLGQAKEGVPVDSVTPLSQGVVTRTVTVSIVATPRGVRTFLQNVSTSLRLFELQSLAFALDAGPQDITITFRAYVFPL